MIVLLVIIIAGSGVTGYSIYRQSQTIISLNNKLTLAENTETSQIATVKTGVDSQISALDTELASAQTAENISITGLQNQLNQVAGNNQTLGNEINATSTQISSLDGKLNSSLNTLSGQISNITPGVATDKIYSNVSPSIVQITDGTYTHGTGFIYDTGGYVVTAAHVIDGLKNISVILSDGTVSPATVVGSALRSDVALLKLAVTTSLTPVKMAADNNVSVGDTVLAVGHPFDLTNSLSTGVVSQLHRFENIGGSTTVYWLADLIQFDAATNPGNSGGPLFDKNGNVVGMVVAAFNPIFGSGINFAVSSARINQVVSNLISSGSTSYPIMGVFVDDLTPTEAASLNIKTVSGALVINVIQGGAAYRAGIQKGDIITAIGSTNITCADALFLILADRLNLGTGFWYI